MKRRKAYAAMKANRIKKLVAEKKVGVLLTCILEPFLRAMGEHVGRYLNCLYIYCFYPGPQGDQETDLQEGREVPQGVQADVQT